MPESKKGRVEDAAHKTGDSIERGARKGWDEIKDAGRKIKRGVEGEDK
jgi:hypothetical protein